MGEGSGIWDIPEGCSGSMGLRLMALQICILITDGKSQDDAEQPALRLKSLGIKVFAVGEQIRGVPIGIHTPE